MKVSILAILAAILATLACQVQVPARAVDPTATPTVLPSPSPLPPTQTATVPTATPADTAVVVQAIVNVRAEPDGAVIGSLEAGDVVEVIECRDSWCKIEHPFDGWIWQGCLTSNPEMLGCEAQ